MSRKTKPTTKPTTPPKHANDNAAQENVKPESSQPMVTLTTQEYIRDLQHATDMGKVMATKPLTASERRVADQTSVVATILQEVFEEARRAIGKFPAQCSPHEGYAVLQEEVDELWDEIKADRGRQLSARKEAIQVAAMAVRYVLDHDPR